MIGRFLFRFTVFAIFVVIALVLWIGCGWMPKEDADD